MFSNKLLSNIPGYTGHIPLDEQNEDICQINNQKFHIPGYAGYIPSIKSENLFGKTYGKITYMSVNNQLHKGSDLPTDLRYNSMVKSEFKDQRDIRKQELKCKDDIEISKQQQFNRLSPVKEIKHLDPSAYKEQKVRLAPSCSLTYEEAYNKAYTKKPQVVFVLGGPGCGKGTQCERIVKEFEFIHLSAGDLLREEMASGSKNAELIDSYIKEGKIVPKEIIVNLIKKAMEKNGWEKNKFLIDGYPRSQDNVIGWNAIMDDIVDFQFILFFDCSEETMTKRVMKRAENSGRCDDNIESLKKRFKTYTESTKPIIEYYQAQNKVIKANAEGTAEDVYKQIQHAFKGL